MHQHFAGDRDFVVAGQMLDDLERCVVERRQAFAELGLGPRFDARDQQAQHVVEHLDLFVVEAIAIVQEEVGHAAKGLDPLRRSTVSYRILELGNNRLRRLLHHGGLACCLFQELAPTMALSALRPR